MNSSTAFIVVLAVACCFIAFTEARHHVVGRGRLEQLLEPAPEISNDRSVSDPTLSEAPGDDPSLTRLGPMPPDEPKFFNAHALSDSLNAANCGKTDISGSRVVSGKDASLGEWPWQAWLQQENGKQLCGGSLITPEWVMTAAHCVLFKDKSKYHVILGDVDFKKHEGTEQRFAVKRIVKHPLFSKPVPYQNDVALFQLSHPARLTPFVKTACLPESFEEVPPGTTCFISGWGQVGGDAKPATVLQQAAMPIVSNTVCAAKLDTSPFGGLKTDNRTWVVTDKMLCAGDAGKTKTHGCYGDSGGPFQCKNAADQWVVEGIVSWGDPNCSSRFHYSVFARVSEFRDWINEKIKQYSSR